MTIGRRSPSNKEVGLYHRPNASAAPTRGSYVRAYTIAIMRYPTAYALAPVVTIEEHDRTIIVVVHAQVAVAEQV